MNQGETDLSGGGADTIEPSKQIVKENSGATTSSFLAELRSGNASAENGGDPSSRGGMGGLRMTSPAVLVAAVLVVSGGLLWGMHTFGASNIMQGEEVKIDYEPDSASKNASHKRLLGELERSSSPAQVPSDQITKNPFKLASKPESAVTTVVDTSDADMKRQVEALAKRTADHQRKISETLGAMNLQGVLGGSSPVARISGETVRVGDTINELFTVKSIIGRTVTMQCDGKEFQLTMEEPKQNNTKATKRK